MERHSREKGFSFSVWLKVCNPGLQSSQMHTSYDIEVLTMGTLPEGKSAIEYF
jgi:hypothetical protein